MTYEELFKEYNNRTRRVQQLKRAVRNIINPELRASVQRRIESSEHIARVCKFGMAKIEAECDFKEVKREIARVSA